MTAQELCDFYSKWAILPEVARKLVVMAGRASFGIKILSGFRTRVAQKALDDAGRPTAPDNLSTHRTCPATGVDVSPIISATNVVKAELGLAAILSGLQWGGRSPVDSQTGIPVDWNHFDLGPRS